MRSKSVKYVQKFKLEVKKNVNQSTTDSSLPITRRPGGLEAFPVGQQLTQVMGINNTSCIKM